ANCGMIIYVTHATSYDFRSELYEPLRSIANDRYAFIFPHEDDTFKDSRESLASCNLVLAEVSSPSTGQGIELGWANVRGLPIICLYKSGVQPSRSLSVVSEMFIEYTSSDDLLQKLKATLDAQFNN